jgi:hypothetical protein
MAAEYSVETVKKLEEKVRAAKLHRPMRVSRYDPGTQLIYNVSNLEKAGTAKIHLVIEKFVGGGFAGQVYRVKVTNVEGTIEGLEEGGIYATKILIPPSGFSRLFRNLLYWIGFQGPFQLQVNPEAARAGGLWQKFIRRGAKIRFGDEKAVVDIYGTFVDENLGGCGELREWVDGRTWRLEVDDRMDLLRQWQRGKKVDESGGNELGSPEYRAKHKFMTEFVKLLHDMGAYEFARQYEWSTCKSQPNALKRYGTESDPAAGLVAVDFRAGLALLPFLPMSPGDFKLIIKGLMRGSLVQFDRGDLSRLEQFVQAHEEQFADIPEMLDELKKAEQVYRDSIPDITHNHLTVPPNLDAGGLAQTLRANIEKPRLFRAGNSSEDCRESHRMAQGRAARQRAGFKNSGKHSFILPSFAAVDFTSRAAQVFDRLEARERTACVLSDSAGPAVFQCTDAGTMAPGHGDRGAEKAHAQR